MSSWYSAGYDWPVSCGRGYGRRRGCWSGNAEDVWFCETCRMALRSYGTEVLRWNVAGGVFLSLISLLNVGDVKPGMTDFFLVVEWIPRPQLTDDMNDSTCASAVHMMVTNTWMNTHTHTELEFPTVPVFWFNTVLCDDNGKTIEQKLWVSEQVDCGRAGLVQVDKAGESLVDLMAPMTSTVVSMVASMVASMGASMVRWLRWWLRWLRWWLRWLRWPRWWGRWTG